MRNLHELDMVIKNTDCLLQSDQPKKKSFAGEDGRLVGLNSIFDTENLNCLHTGTNFLARGTEGFFLLAFEEKSVNHLQQDVH